jgi:lipopolysaccharide transport system permease protein
VTLGVTLISTAAVRGLPLQALLLPLLLAWLVVLAWGAVVLLAALAARFRDVVAIVPLFVQAGIFVTPVGYPLEGAPANIHRVLELNPASGVIEAWRWSLLDTPNPSLTVIGIAVGWTIVLTSLAWYVFGRLEVRLADYI